MVENQNSLLVLHLSDLHFGKYHYFIEDDEGLDYWIYEFKEILDKKGIKPDIILITGDITSIGDREEFNKARNFLKNCLLKNFDIPLIIVPGNHDLQWANKPEIIHIKRFDNYLDFLSNMNLIKSRLKTQEYFINPYFVKEIPEKNVMILGINTCLYIVHKNKENINSYKGGYFYEDNVKVIKIDEKILKNYLKSIDSQILNKYKFKIVILHHNIEPENSQGLIYPNPKDFISILKRYGFDIILHGHQHKREINKINNTLLIGAGSLGVKESKRYYLNDINVIDIKKDNFLPGFEENDIKIVCLKTFQLDYKSHHDPVQSFEEKCDTTSMSYDQYKIIVDYVKDVKAKIEKVEKPQNLPIIYQKINKLSSRIEKFDNPNANYYSSEFKYLQSKQLEKVTDFNQIFEEIQLGFINSWNSRNFKDAIDILLNLAFFPLTFFLNDYLKPNNDFISKLYELPDERDIISIKSKLDLLKYLNQIEDSDKEKKKNDFLSKIGKVYDPFYKWVDFAFVPPIEYIEIEEMLNVNKIVFITGTPEFGKTYTAVYLMWKYYNQGYTPKWVPGKENIEEVSIEESLEKIKRILEPKHIVYFEDPFGKTKFEGTENSEKVILSIIREIRDFKDTYVIITSRKEIFKKFKLKAASKEIFDVLEKTLDIKKPSYSTEKRKEILIKLAILEKCFWLTDIKLRNFIMEQIEDKKNIPTPLNIKDFVIASVNASNIERLFELIRFNSEKSSFRFAKDIQTMKLEHIVFLSLLFVTIRIHINLIESFYNSLSEKFRNLRSFEEIFKDFLNDKISISEFDYIQFSHPSYLQALKFLLNNESKFKEVYQEILIFLVENDIDQSELYVSWAIVNNYEKLSEEVRQLLITLSKKEKHARVISYIIRQSFSKLPEQERNQILLDMCEIENTTENVIWTIVENFNNLSEEVKNKFFEIVEKEVNALYVAKAVIYNFDKLPQEVIDILIKLSEKENTAKYVVYVLRKNYKQLEDEIKLELLLKLSKIKGSARGILSIIRQNFKIIPSQVRNDLLINTSKVENAIDEFILIVIKFYELLTDNVRKIIFTLSKSEQHASKVATILRSNFNQFPNYIRNKLLLNMYLSKNALNIVIWIILENFKNLPEAISQIILSLSENKSFTDDVVNAIRYNFENIPYEFRNKVLLNVLNLEGEKENVILVIIKNYKELPEEISQFIFVSTDKDNTAKFVSKGLLTGYKNLPKDARERLLLSLAKKKSLLSDVANILYQNQNKITKKVVHKLFLTLSITEIGKELIRHLYRDSIYRIPRKLQKRFSF